MAAPGTGETDMAEEHTDALARMRIWDEVTGSVHAEREDRHRVADDISYPIYMLGALEVHEPMVGHQRVLRARAAPSVLVPEAPGGVANPVANL